MVARKVEVVVKSSISRELVAANVAASFLRNLPRFHEMEKLGKFTGPCAIVGGGPSLRSEYTNLIDYDGTVISVGTALDWLVEHDVRPNYHVICDPDPVASTFIKYPWKFPTYLLASQCHESVFEALKDCDVRLWHAAVVDTQTNQSIADFKGEPTISGGDAVILRAWPMAAVMGFRDFHFFGFDCSFPVDCESQHAYSYNHVREEPIGVTVEHTGERFITTPGWVAQLNAFMRMLAMSAGQFEVTIHGDSLVASACAKPRTA